jgi:hypothetical protein
VIKKNIPRICQNKAYFSQPHGGEIAYKKLKEPQKINEWAVEGYKCLFVAG